MEGSNQNVAKLPQESAPSELEAMAAARRRRPEGPRAGNGWRLVSGSRGGAQTADALPCFLLGKTREPESQSSHSVRSRYVGA